MSETKKTVLITGGSSGIGFEFSKLFAKDGYRLVIVSKPVEELEKAEVYFKDAYPDTEILYLQKDLAIQTSAEEVFKYTEEKGLQIDVLVNNAGFATYGNFNELPVATELAMLNLNMITVYYLTRLYIKGMIARDEGKILNVSSTAAFAPVPDLAAYAGTKIFVYYYSMAIHEELKQLGSKVTVTALCPPPTRTGFQKRAKMDKSTVFSSKYLSKDADFVAEKAYNALMEEKSNVLPGKLVEFSIGLMNPLAKPKKAKKLMKAMQKGLV